MSHYSALYIRERERERESGRVKDIKPVIGLHTITHFLFFINYEKSVVKLMR